MFPPTSKWEDVLGDYVAPDDTAAGGAVEVALTSLFEMRPVSVYDAADFVVAYHVEAFGSDLKAIGVDGTVLPLPEPGHAVLALTALLIPGLLRLRCPTTRCSKCCANPIALGDTGSENEVEQNQELGSGLS